jgi:Protein of unknown function (DUF2505)
MPRSFDLSAEYDGTVEQVHGAFADRQYWLARLADSGADAATLDAMDVGADGSIVVTTTQVLRWNRLPAIVTQFYKRDLRVGRRETWTPLAGGRARATVTGNIPEAPVTLSGDAVLEPRDPATGAAQLDFHGTVEVRVPLVGGKIESFISTQLVDLLTAEQQFTMQWLARHSWPPHP